MQDALFIAIYRGDAETVEALLRAGLSPDVTDQLHGESALGYAASHGQDACVAALLRHGAVHDPLPMVEAAVTDNPAVLQRFLEMGGDPNAVDADGRTPLGEARGWGNQRVIATLLAAGGREGK